MDRGVYVLTENKNKQRNRKVENEAGTTLVLYYFFSKETPSRNLY